MLALFDKTLRPKESLGVFLQAITQTATFPWALWLGFDFLSARTRDGAAFM